MSEPFDLERAIYEVRSLEDKMEKMQEELDIKLKPLKDYAMQMRTAILKYLNDTKQKSAQTEQGGTHWRSKVTYSVQDREEFRRHVIGMEAWELIAWAAAPNACEDFTNEHGEEPPGLKRSATQILSITPPTKANAAAAAKKNGAAKAAE